MKPTYAHTDAFKPYVRPPLRAGEAFGVATDRLRQQVMRHPGGLSIGERELVAALVSRANDSQLMYQTHAEAAAILFGEGAISFLLNQETDHLSTRLRALLVVATLVQGNGDDDHLALPDAIDEAKFYGASEEEVFDTIVVSSLISMLNRYVAGMGIPASAIDTKARGQDIAQHGYYSWWGSVKQTVLGWFVSSR